MSRRPKNAFADSSSDDDDPAARTKRSKAAEGLKSLFVSDQKTTAVAATSDPLQYTGPKRGRSKSEINFNPSETNAGPAAPPVPGAAQQQALAQAVITVWRGDTEVPGRCVLLLVLNVTDPYIMIGNREKKTLCKIKVDNNLQLKQNEEHAAYLWDPALSLHWYLEFSSPFDCLHFVCQVTAIHHFKQGLEGPQPADEELRPAEKPPKLKKGDTARVSLCCWLTKRVPGTGLACIGKLVDQIAAEAPRSITLGKGTLMVGVEDGLVGMGVGGRKMLFLPPKKTKASGLGNPEIGRDDSVTVVVTVHQVEGDGDDNDDTDDKDHRQRNDNASMASAASPDPGRPSSAIVATTTTTPSAAPAIAAAPVVPPTAPTSTTEALLHALVLQQLQQSKQPSEPPPAPTHPPHRDENGDARIPAHVERSLDRINQQLSALYEKIDRLDIEQKLVNNNEKVERMMKKAVGKLPVNDIDIEDATKDRDQLLAKVEAQRLRLEEMTDNYHKALEQIGKHSEKVAGLKNDLTIERETAQERYKELKDRHRLEMVDAEVKHRMAIEKAVDKAREEAKEAGYAEGYQVGKIDGIALSGSTTTQELQQVIVQKDQRILELQTTIGELEKRGFDDRRVAAEEREASQGIIDRLEERERMRKKDIGDGGTAQVKRLRRVLNDTYAAIESQFYATESEHIEISEALTMVKASVKQEARLAAEEIKAESQIRASEPLRIPEGPSSANEGDYAPADYGDHSAHVAAVNDEAGKMETEKEDLDPDMEELRQYLAAREKEAAQEERMAQMTLSEKHAAEDDAQKQRQEERDREPRAEMDGAPSAEGNDGGGLSSDAIEEMARRYGIDLNEAASTNTRETRAEEDDDERSLGTRNVKQPDNDNDTAERSAAPPSAFDESRPYTSATVSTNQNAPMDVEPPPSSSRGGGAHGAASNNDDNDEEEDPFDSPKPRPTPKPKARPKVDSDEEW